MFSDVQLNVELTQAKFGYNPEDLPEGSYKIVCIECCNCGREVERPFIHSSRRHRCPTVIGDDKRCFKCGEWKDLSLFNRNPSTSGGVAKMCRQCHNSHNAVKKCEINRLKKKQSSFNEDFSYWIRTKSYYIKNNSKRKGIKCNLDEAYLMSQWNAQGGLCFYSGLEMKVEPRMNGFQSWFSPSLDRKDPTLGYTQGNVVWACSCVNSFKQSMTDSQFFELLKTIKWNTDANG